MTRLITQVREGGLEPPRPRTREPKSRASANSATRARSVTIVARYRCRVSTTRRRRPALILLVIAAAGGCLGLAWWQWTRFESTSGDFQNLGYALQWPLFAGFCVYAYFKFVRYEEAPPEPQAGDLTEIPAGLLPDRPASAPDSDADPTLREYNDYLAELARHDSDSRPSRE